jgi:hypothetical protein
MKTSTETPFKTTPERKESTQEKPENPNEMDIINEKNSLQRLGDKPQEKSSLDSLRQQASLKVPEIVELSKEIP